MKFRRFRATANFVRYDQAGAMLTTSQSRLCSRSMMKVTTVLIWKATISKLGKPWKHQSTRVSASQLACPISIGNGQVPDKVKQWFSDVKLKKFSQMPKNTNQLFFKMRVIHTCKKRTLETFASFTILFFRYSHQSLITSQTVYINFRPTRPSDLLIDLGDNQAL